MLLFVLPLKPPHIVLVFLLLLLFLGGTTNLWPTTTSSTTNSQDHGEPVVAAAAVLVVPVLVSALTTVAAAEQCSVEKGGGICPTGNTCCPMIMKTTWTLKDEDFKGTTSTLRSSSSGGGVANDVQVVSGCIPNDLGSYRATCCTDGEEKEEENGYRTGCGVGYQCSRSGSRSSGNQDPDSPAGTTLTCQAASNEITDPLVQILPRYRLCRGVDKIGIVHGLPVLDDDTTVKLAYYSSHGDITDTNNNNKNNSSSKRKRNSIRTALIVVHGANRNADGYYCSATAAVDQQTGYNMNHDDDSVLVIAPFFPIITDDLVLREGGEAIRWSNTDGNGPWRYGANAVWPPSMRTRPNAFSSFDGMDKLVAVLMNETQFPNLGRITIAGHSSGGQFVQRWSLMTSMWDNNDTKKMRAVVANPSSYAYLTPLRFFDNEWRIPTNTNNNCSDYNQWEWGLELDPQDADNDDDRVPSYVKTAIDKLGVNGLKSRFAERSLVYLVGGQDICDGGSWCNSHGLETTCRDNLQGSNRRERHDRYIASLDLLNILYHRLVVPGVGHDHSLMFNSENGLKALFGTLDDDDDDVAFKNYSWNGKKRI